MQSGDGMRIGMMVAALALAGCGVNQGWNPNYQFGATPYGEYRVARERALVTGSDFKSTVPVALPVEAPTPARIAGRDPVTPSATMGMQRKAATTKAVAPAKSGGPVQIVPDSMLPKTSSGPYAGTTPVLVRYAFTTTHTPGTRVHARSGGSAAQATQLCAEYPSADRAQLAFLGEGGPARDPRGMDPDGDGFVCGWNPAPYRQSQL